jgi:hypothetical protein
MALRPRNTLVAPRLDDGPLFFSVFLEAAAESGSDEIKLPSRETLFQPGRNQAETPRP